MTEHNHTEVLVVGAGPIGLTAALLLADAGVRTTVIDRAQGTSDLPRAISLQDESLRTLEQLGVAEALKAESLLDTGSRYYGLGGRLLAEAKPVPSKLGQPAKSQFDQPILEELLYQRALMHPSLEVRMGCEAVAVSQDLDGVFVDVQDASGTHRITANWLIGADGGKSFVRQALGIQLEGTTQPQRWIVIDLLREQRHYDPYAQFHCDGKRPYVLVPGVNGRLRIEFMLFDHEDADEMTTPERIRELVVPKFRAELDPQDVRRAAVYVAHQRVAETYRRDRAFLIGDAAHLMPPFAGQGLNAGIRDATNLAWKLIDTVRGGASEKLLDSYGIERREHGAKMVKVSRRIGAVVMATNGAVTRARDLGVRAASLAPKVHEFLANMRFITPPDYRAGLAIPETAKRPLLSGVTAGRALPQPQVRDALGSTAPLDHYLGEGWAVIGLGASPERLSDYWTGIDATKIQLGGGSGSESERVLALTETTPTLGRGRTGAPVFIAVRPDRYVAAVFTADQEADVVAQLRTYLDDRARRARRESVTQ